MEKSVSFDEKSMHKLTLLSMLFLASLLTANITAVKLFSVGELVMTAGILMYPITFLFLDTITEVWGRKTAQRIVWSGLFCNILVIGVIQLASILPAASFWPHQESYEVILGAVPRMVLASLTAYIISQSLDITLFTWIKNKTHGKKLWLRTNISTMASQLIDSLIFMFVAFFGVLTVSEIFTAMFSEYLIKLSYAFLGTPFVYLLVKWARNGKKEEIAKWQEDQTSNLTV